MAPSAHSPAARLVELAGGASRFKRGREEGTGYLTDVGMTGPHDSVIGVEIEPALGRFLNALPARFETATGNPRLNAVVIESDPQSGRATDIDRISLSASDIDELAALQQRSEPPQRVGHV